MILNANTLVTLEELKNFMGIDLTDTSKDSTLTIYINGISNKIEKLVGRKLMATDYIEKYPGTDANELVLKHFPINIVTSVMYVTENQDSMSIDDYQYDIDSEEGILYKDNGWLVEGFSSYMSRLINYPQRHIRVEYNAGFVDAPPDLKLICLQYISDLYVADIGKGGTLKSYSISDVRMDFKDEVKFSSDQFKTIMSYKGMHF
jgi:hypothetical protein